MSATMQLRLATRAAVPRLMEIRGAVRENKLGDPRSVTFDHYIDFIDRCGVRVWDDSGIVGLSAGDVADGSVWALFVDPEHEGRGIGRALIAWVCRALAEAGHTRATPSTEPGTRAERFYRLQGWRDVGRNKKREVIFEKALPEQSP